MKKELRNPRSSRTFVTRRLIDDVHGSRSIATHRTSERASQKEPIHSSMQMHALVTEQQNNHQRRGVDKLRKPAKRRIKKLGERFRALPRSRQAYILMVLLLVFSLVSQLIVIRPARTHAQTFTTPSHTPTSCTGNTGGGTVNWTNPNNATATDAVRATVVVQQSASKTLICTGYGFNSTDTIPAQASIISVNISYVRHSSTLLTIGGNYYAVKGGTITSGFNEILWPTGVDSPNTRSSVWGTSWTPADINNNAGFGGALDASNATNTAATANVDSISISVTYSVNPTLNMMGFVWENDDEDQAKGDAYDSNSAQATANTALSGVRKGERLTLRTQLKNTSGANLSGDLALFYDKNGDGNFIKANLPEPALSSGNCGPTNTWSCSAVDTSSSANFGQYSSFAVSPDGVPYISYYEAGTGNNLKVAQYVGSGGTGCTPSTVTAWSCTAIDSSVNGGQYTSIAVNSKGVPYVSYFDVGSTSLKVAFYDGDDTSSGCAVVTWTCTTVNNDNSLGGSTSNGQYTSITFNSADVPYIVYYGDSWGEIFIAYNDGTGSGCVGGTGPGSGTWTCGEVHWGGVFGDVGTHASIAFSPNGIPWVTYYDESNDLLDFAYYNSDNVPGSNCQDTHWYPCTQLDNSVANIGQYSSIAFSPNGTPYVSYYDVTNRNLRVAYYDGDTTSSGCGASGTMLAWTCTTVEANSSAGGTNDVGKYTSIAFSPSGVPYISYYDTSNTSLRLARYVGDGAQSSCAGGSSDWACIDIETTNDVGQYSSLAFDPDGIPYVSYYDNTNKGVRVANLARLGEINLTLPAGGGFGDILSTAKIGGSCSGGGTFSNGALLTQNRGNTFSLPNGSCTEVAFTIDTSQAVPGTTYRFIVATADSVRPDKGLWRGPNTISQYPTLTIASDTDFKASKGTEPQGSGTCTLSSWTCLTLDSAAGYVDSVAFSPTGVPYIEFLDGNADLNVGQYVGSGGNCFNSAWNCTVIDTNQAFTGSIAFSPSGALYTTYFDSSFNVRIAKYVSTGGNCGGNAWTCTTIEASGSSLGATMAFSPLGVPYMVYAVGTNTRIAQYVSFGGNCGGGAWTCTTLDTGAGVQGSEIAFSPAGVPYIIYYKASTGYRVAQYVAAGGSGCSTSAWTCQTINNVPAAALTGVDIAFSPTGIPYIAFIDDTSTNGNLYVANYVSSGGNCGGSAWNCVNLESQTNLNGSSLAFTPSGAPYLVYAKNNANDDIKTAQYVGSGGNCGGNAWVCTIVSSNPAIDASSPVMAFSPAGVPYMFYGDVFNGGLYLAKPALYDKSPVMTTLNSAMPGSRNARLGFGQYRLSDGRSPRTNASGLCGSSVAGNMGICALYNDGGLMDSITANANERPYFNFAQRFDSNSILPTASWAGRSDVAPSTAGSAGDIVLQVYNVTSGSWQTVATNSTSTNCNTDNCYLKGIPSGTISDFFDADGGNYWMYWRIYQTENTSGSETLKTDLFQLQFINKQMRHGTMFENNVRRNFTF